MLAASAYAERRAACEEAARLIDHDGVVYNASGRARGPFVELDPAEVARAIAISAYGGFLVAQQALKRMLPNGSGAILFTGASASVKGYAQSAPFAIAFASTTASFDCFDNSSNLFS